MSDYLDEQPAMGLGTVIAGWAVAAAVLLGLAIL
jgi:hypothetical protein